MARELSVSVEVTGTSEADAAIARLAMAFTKAGDSALVAAEKADKFEKAYKDNNARKQAKQELDALSGATDKTARSTDALTQAILRYAAPAALGAAVKQTLAWANNIAEQAERTNLSVTAVQQLTKVAEKNGSTFATMAGLIQQSEQRLYAHNKQAEAAVKLLGLTPEALLRMDPLERLRAIAKGLADLKDPAQRSAAEMAIFGRQADAAAVALNAVAAGADKAESALGPEFIRVGNDAQAMLETLTNKALELGKAFFLLPGVIGNWAGQMGKDSTFGTVFEMLGLHGSRASQMPGLPGAPGGVVMPSPLGVPGLPSDYAAIQKALALPKPSGGASGGARVLPFVPSTLGSSAAAIFALGNSPALLPFSLPFQSSANPLAASFQTFNGVGFAPTVGMNAPGAAGGGFMNFLKGRGAGIAGAGIGALTSLFGSKLGLSSTGSSIGAMAGSFLGPLGSGIGSLAGGLLGKLFGGNSDKKQISAARKGEDFAAIKAQAESLGISMDKVFGAKKIKDFEAALKNVTQQITQQEAESNKVHDAMARWGLTIEDMGAKFQQAEMNKTALQMAEDFVTLGNAGADTTKILEKMAPTLSEFVQKSKLMGTEVPREMQPVLEAAQKQGLLLDENGEKLTDEAFASIKWAQTMTQGFDKVESAINRLTDAILGIGQGFDEAGAAVDRFRQKADGIDYSGGGGKNEPDGFATGGVAGRDFRRPGYGDWFPAMLRRGERVLPPGAGGGGVSIGNLTVNGSFGSRADAVEEIGESVVRYIERRGGRLVA